jgi:hypothetical protein
MASVSVSRLTPYARGSTQEVSTRVTMLMKPRFAWVSESMILEANGDRRDADPSPCGHRLES